MRTTKGWRARASRIAAATALLSMSLGGVAVADDIYNTLDATIDVTVETMTLEAGGANGSTTLKVQPRNDIENGCNIQGGESLTVSVNSSIAAVATVSPSSVVFASCGDEKTLTVTPKTEGSTTVSVSQTGNTTGGSFNLAPATFKVNVNAAAVTNTPPIVVVTGVEEGISYNKGSLPAAICVVTDAEDGGSSFSATLSAITGPHASDNIGSQTASCSYTDGGGLTRSASATYNIVDPSAPVITHALTPATPDGANGWYKSSVNLTWTVTENESPNSLSTTGCANQNVTSDQLETTYSCSATSAGGSAGPVEARIKRDATAPTVDLVGGPADGQSYYFGSVPVAPTCDADDATSGLAGACSVSGYSVAVGTHTVEATATDNAGNVRTASSTYTVLAWTLNGFYQPVDMNGVYNTVKSGSTVPLKFEVFAGATELTDAAIAKFTANVVSCTDSSATTDEIEVTSTGGTSLRYDSTGGQFIQNWQTPKGKAGTCYKVTMTTQDGSSISALFKLK